MQNIKWKKINPPYRLEKIYIFLFIGIFLSAVGLIGYFGNPLLALGLIVVFSFTTLLVVIIRKKHTVARKTVFCIDKHIRGNNLLQSYVTDTGKEVITYYPDIWFRLDEEHNSFYLRYRLDGSTISQRFRGIEQSLADTFKTICIGVREERGYIIYQFEMYPQEQLTINSMKEIDNMITETEIKLTDDISWDWKKTPHLLLTGRTGSGKTKTALYLAACMVKQGVRVIYIDPKNDDDVRAFMMFHPRIKYVTDLNEIAKVMRETEEEIRARQVDLDNMGLDEAPFNPVFVFFDEAPAYLKITEKKTSEEVLRRIASMVITGRSKQIFTGIILQRPDAEFLGGGIVRENLGCRICMGGMSSLSYRMAFGPDFEGVKNRRTEIGSGLIYRDGIDTRPREFLAPHIKNGSLND